jgi:hypothetical protein
MSDYAKNFVYGVVTTAPSPATTGTTIKMSDADAAVFPDPATVGVGAYDVTVWPAGTKPLTANAEIVRITAKGASSGGETVFTITRQQQSTSARTVVVGDQIAMTITAKTVADIIAMGTASMVRGEVPGGAVNSSNTTFTTASRFQPGALRVYQNGIRLKGGTEDYTEGTQGFTMAVAPVTGDLLLVDYETNTTAFMQGSSSFVYDETPSGTVNSSNVTFTLANTPVAGTLVLFRDGQRLVPGGADYTLSTATITFVTAPTTGSVLRADYQLFASVAGNADTLDGFHANTTPTVGQIPVLDSNAKLPNSILAAEAWTVFTPTIANLTLGSGGSKTGAYFQIGKTILFRVRVVLGTSPSVGAMALTLPVTSIAYPELVKLGDVTVLDAGTAYYNCVMLSDGGLYALNAGATYLNHITFSSTVPMTWAVNDGFSIIGAYEAA